MCRGLARSFYDWVGRIGRVDSTKGRVDQGFAVRLSDRPLGDPASGYPRTLGCYGRANRSKGARVPWRALRLVGAGLASIWQVWVRGSTFASARPCRLTEWYRPPPNCPGDAGLT